MKSRIRIPREVLVLCTDEEKIQSQRLSDALLDAGGEGKNCDHLEFNARIVTFEGPDEEVRALTTYLMHLIHKYTTVKRKDNIHEHHHGPHHFHHFGSLPDTASN